MLIPSTITARRTRRYTSTLYIRRTIHGVGYNPMNDGGRYSIWSPILSNPPPTRPTLTPPFTNVIAVGNSGTGKTHVALGLGLAACQRGVSVGFTTAAALVQEMMEARDERRLVNLQRQLSRLNLLIIDELGFVPVSRTGEEGSESANIA